MKGLHGKRRKAAARQREALHQETLEPRLALAIAVVNYPRGVDQFTREAVPGRVVIASNQADDVFVKQVASVNQDLIVSNNSSFLEYQTVDNIEQDYDSVFITNGTRYEERGLLPDGFPRSNATGSTVFALFQSDVRLDYSFKGTLSYTQSDGSQSEWQFTNWNGSNYTNTLSIVSGPGYGGLGFGVDRGSPAFAPEVMRPGWIRPLSAVFTNGARAFESQALVTFDWSAAVLSSPESFISYAYNTGVSIAGADQAGTLVLGSALARESTLSYTLPAALAAIGPGGGAQRSLGIIPSTLQCTLMTEYGELRFVADNSNVLRTPAGDSAAYIDAGSRGVIVLRGRVVGGQAEFKVTRWEFLDSETSNKGDILVVRNQVANAVIGGSLTLDATYLTYTQDAVPNDVTMFAGQDFGRELTVDLLTPGSSFYADSAMKIDSDVLEALGTGEKGDYDIRATNININAPMSTEDRFIAGSSQAIAAQRYRVSQGVTPFETSPSLGAAVPTARAAAAVAEVGALGAVTQLTVLPGQKGYGYDYNNPPVVTVEPRATNRATGQVIRISGGVNLAIEITNRGENYRDGTTVVFSRPENGFVQSITLNNGGANYESKPDVILYGGGGTGATAEANWDPVTKRVTGVRLTNGGQNYVTSPQVYFYETNSVAITTTATAARASAFLGYDTAEGVVETADGRVTRINVTKPGSGYSTPPTVTIRGQAAGPGEPPPAGATAVATVSGSVVEAQLTYGGIGYTPTTPVVASVSGGPSDFDAAIEFSVDDQGSVRDDRVLSIDVRDGGSGYSDARPPAVTIVGGDGNALATATVVQGRVTKVTVTSSGSGYRTPPLVIISGNQVVGGRAAVATAVVSSPKIISGGLFASLANAQLSFPSPVSGGNALVQALGGVEERRLTNADGTPFLVEKPVLGTASASVGVYGLKPKVTDPGLGYDSKKAVDVYVWGGGVPYDDLPFTEGDSARGYYGTYDGTVITPKRVDEWNDVLARFYKLKTTQDFYADPTVYIAPPSDVAAFLAAVSRDGELSGYVKLQGGSGYFDRPSVLIAAPTIIRQASISVGSADVDSDPTSPTFRGLKKVTVVDEGLGYRVDNPPSVVISQPDLQIPGARAARGEAIVSTDGKLVGVKLTEAGYGYSKQPTIRLEQAPPLAIAVQAISSSGINAQTGEVTRISVTTAGYGYRVPPRVEVAPPDEGLGGVQARAEAVIDTAGRVVKIVVTDPGAGYRAAPRVTIAEANPRAFVERLDVNSAIEAKIYEFYVGDDFGTDIDRGRLYVSPTGGLSAERIPFAANEVTGDALASTLTFVGNQTATVVRGASVFGVGVPDGTRITTVRFNAQTNQTIATVTAGALVAYNQSGGVELGGGATASYIEATTADIYVDSRIEAISQSYLFNSDEEDGQLSPFVFSTRSPSTGNETGNIIGRVVNITLGNRMPTPLFGASAYSTVDISTEIETLRIRAGTDLTNPAGPFPYQIDIREKDDLQLAAVAASSMPITIEAGRNITMPAGLSTASDLTITAKNADPSVFTLFTVQAPITSDYGRISISADAVSVRNSLVVKAAAVAPDALNDIVLDARRGSMELFGLVSAVNDVSLRQTNRDRTTIGAISGDSRVRARNISIESEGSVSIGTDALSLTGRSVTGFKIDELNDIRIDSLTSGGLVSLTARGVDPVNRMESAANEVDALAACKNVAQPGASQPVWEIDVSSSGSGYRLAPLVRVSAPDVATPSSRSMTAFAEVDDSTGKVKKVIIVDQGVGYTKAPTVQFIRVLPALEANLREVNQLTVSTPNGSSKVFIDTLETVALGDAAALRAGSAAAVMQAAGRVDIRSSGADFTVYDAPVGGLNARYVRVATSQQLTSTRWDAAKKEWVQVSASNASLPRATYNPGTPGTIAATLSGDGMLPKIDGVTLVVGDRVLVKNQENNPKTPINERRENGIYQVTKIGGGVLGSSRWELTRAADSDTSAELPNNTLVRVGEGAKQFYRVGYVEIPTTVVERTTANQIQLPKDFNRALYYKPSSPTESSLQKGQVVTGTGIAAGATIDDIIETGDGRLLVRLKRVAANVALQSTAEEGKLTLSNFSGFANLFVGQRVFGDGIAQNTLITKIDPLAKAIWVSPGGLPYSKTAPFSAVNGGTVASEFHPELFDNWIDLDASFNDYAALNVGQWVTGACFTNGKAQVTGIDPATRRVGFAAGSISATATPTAAAPQPVTFIPLSTVKFGMVQGVGSGLATFAMRPLGMARVNVDEVVNPATKLNEFPTNIGSDVDGTSVDLVVSTTGTRNESAGSLGKMISLRQNNQSKSAYDTPQAMTFAFGSLAGPIRLEQELPQIRQPFALVGNKSVVVDGARINMTRTGGAVGVNTVINGFEFVKGSGFEFVKGSGSGVDKEPRLVAGASIAGVTIGGFSRGAAIQVTDAEGILVNSVVLGRGVSSTGVTSAAVNAYGVRIGGMGGKASATVNNSVILSTKQYLTKNETGRGVVVEKNIDPKSPPDAPGSVTLVGSTLGNNLETNFVGIEIRGVSGATSRIGVDPVPASSTYDGTFNAGDDVLVIEDAVDKLLALWDKLYLGQAVNAIGLAAGTNIAAISPREEVGGATAQLRIKLSRPATATADMDGTPISFGTPGRNAVQYNNRGIVLSSGDAVITNTDVRSNVNSGIELIVAAPPAQGTVDVNAARTVSVGTSPSRGGNSNAIYGNGGWAILVNQVGADRIKADYALSKSSAFKARGNFFGGATNSTTVVANKRGFVGVGDFNKATAQVAATELEHGFNKINPTNKLLTTEDIYLNQYLRIGVPEGGPENPSGGGQGGTVSPDDKPKI
jgi:hypothetical protein